MNLPRAFCLLILILGGLTVPPALADSPATCGTLAGHAVSPRDDQLLVAKLDDGAGRATAPPPARPTGLSLLLMGGVALLTAQTARRRAA